VVRSVVVHPGDVPLTSSVRGSPTRSHGCKGGLCPRRQRSRIHSTSRGPCSPRLLGA
jgi:hypothetical protein